MDVDYIVTLAAAAADGTERTENEIKGDQEQIEGILTDLVRRSFGVRQSFPG
jgi:hypothetical protein